MLSGETRTTSVIVCVRTLGNCRIAKSPRLLGYDVPGESTRNRFPKRMDNKWRICAPHLLNGVYKHR